MPDLQRNLISFGQVDDEYKIRIYKGLTRISLNFKEIISSPKSNGIFTLQAKPLVGNNSTIVKSYDNKTLIWHRRLGHNSEKGIDYFKQIKMFRK